MEKALRILDDAIKALESEVRIWTKQGDLDIVEKCKNEIKQCTEAIEKLRGGECSNESSGLHLQRVMASALPKFIELLNKGSFFISAIELDMDMDGEDFKQFMVKFIDDVESHLP